MHDKPLGFSTRAIHVGQDADPASGATVPPITLSSTFTQMAPGEHKGFAYARSNNPTRKNLEACLAALERGNAAAAFASGLAGTHAIVAALLRPGDSIVAYSDLYGGTYRIFERVFRPWGLDIRYCDSKEPAAFAKLTDGTTRLLWLETPTNPLLHLLDIRAIATAVRGKGAWPTSLNPADCAGGGKGPVVVVDNTFASPALQNPLALGADVVLHSTTKYLGGHSDVIGGAVIAADPKVMEPVRFVQNAAGGVPSPFDCYLTHRGIKTLAVRMKRHCENAAQIAKWATEQRGFEKVYYPGLPNHPDHALAKTQMCGFGGMVTCVLRGGFPAAKAFMSSTKLFACAESLGGVESLVNHPAIMTHASMPREVRERIGVVDGLIRLSVGIEEVDDLIADLQAALGAAERA